MGLLTMNTSGRFTFWFGFVMLVMLTIPDRAVSAEEAVNKPPMLHAQQWYWALDPSPETLEPQKNLEAVKNLSFTPIDEKALANLENLLPGKRAISGFAESFPASKYSVPNHWGSFWAGLP